MYKQMRQDFSWSLFKYNTFKYCERAYFYHYYGSWNGWDQYASQEAKASFRLKHLKTKELWLKSILKKSFLLTIKLKRNSAESFASDLKNILYKTLSIDLRDLYLEVWKNDPKQICIDKIYYKEESIDDAADWIKCKIIEYIESFPDSKLIQKLYAIPYPAYINTELPLSFNIDDLKVWCSPDLAWNYHGQIDTLNLNINKSKNWAFLAGINVLFFSKKYKKTYSEIISHTLFSDKNMCYETYGIKHPNEIKKIIRESASQMYSRLTFNQKAYIENFSKTTETEKCRQCSYRKICHQ